MKIKKKEESIFNSAKGVLFLVLIFKIIGFIKQTFIAYYFGANTETDIFFASYDFIYGVSTSIFTAVGVAVISIYATAREEKGIEYVDGLISKIFIISLFFALCLCFCIIFFSPYISELIAPSYSTENITVLKLYLKILAPMVLLIAFQGLSVSILEANKYFKITKLNSLILSLAMIASCVFLSERFHVMSLAIANYVSKITFTVLLVFFLRKCFGFTIGGSIVTDEVILILRRAIPLVLGNGIVWINMIVDNSIASSIGTGTISALSYCYALEEFVTKLAIVNITNIIFVHLAEKIAQRQIEGVQDLFTNSAHILVCVLIPVTVVSVVFSENIVALVYYRGNFSYEIVKLTALALAGYAISFPLIGLQELSTKTMYAFGETAKPMISSTISVTVNIVFSIVLSKYIGILGIALGTSISYFVRIGMNLYYVKRFLPQSMGKNQKMFVLKIVLVTIVLFGAAILLRKLDFPPFLMLTISTIVIFSVSFFLFCILDIKEIKTAAHKVRKRLFKLM